MNTITTIDFNAITSNTRRTGTGTEWSLRYRGVVVADGHCVGGAVESRLAAMRACAAARTRRDAIVDRYRFAVYAAGRA